MTDSVDRAIRHYRVPASRLVPALMGAALFLLAGLGGLVELVAVTGRGDVRIPIAGSRRYVERIIGEIGAYQAELGRRSRRLSAR